MNYPSIRIEGAILSPDLIAGLEEAASQRPADFGFDSTTKVKEEIARAWADAQDYWRIFQRKVATLKPGPSGPPTATTETRNLWVAPLLQLLGYQIDRARTATINDKSYAISHAVTNRGDLPIHIIGYGETAGLDRKPERAGGQPSARMSAHALVQEYLNLTDQLYGLVTNGRVLRLLRDSSRLVKLSYLEFDLERIFSDGLFADFAVLFRLLHASRLPATRDGGAACLLERYHQESLDAGARIRAGLSRAVETALRDFANGFLADPANTALHQAITSGALQADAYYQQLLRLIYRLLFLLVIEERDLVFPTTMGSDQRRPIYDRYYSLQRLRRLADKRHLGDHRHHDLWQGLLTTFRLFEAAGPGHQLGVAPLAGDLFDPAAIGLLSRCTLSNATLLACLRSLSLYQHPGSGQLIRVNYAALNVEEFGSVYENLLEYEPIFLHHLNRVEFAFAQGDDRAATGSHYTDDSLVQPLLTHSLDYLIADALRTRHPEAALLALRVADISCGSGHILLAAARRIALALATVRTGEEQPSPAAFRAAVRDVIRECIYGVDLNPLAVELCKVALWLEAHNPGEPLNFLDHHIKCGNAIVGYVRREELDAGVPDEAFASQLVNSTGGHKATGDALRQRNKAERQQQGQLTLAPAPAVQQQLDQILQRWRTIAGLPESTPTQIDAKKRRYQEFMAGADAWLLTQIAAIPLAQFYLPKSADHRDRHITDGEFRDYWHGERAPQGQATAAAWAMALQKRFFHWFLEFPEIMARGGFDCILGNPPYLGGQALSSTYGYAFCTYVKWAYEPTGLSELVTYFVRRIYNLLRPGGFTAFITTNSIKDGDVRKDGLEQVLAQGGSINFAVRSIKWPGRANLVVSLVAIHKGPWSRIRVLDNKQVDTISPRFEDYEDVGEPVLLSRNADRVFVGSIFLGDGFLLSHEEAARMKAKDARLNEVILPTINGQSLSNDPLQEAERQIIFFADWPLSKAQEYGDAFQHVVDHVKPYRDTHPEKGPRTKWWLFKRPTIELYSRINKLQRCFVIAQTGKHHAFSATSPNQIFLQTCYVFTSQQWDEYAILQSNIHYAWVLKYSGALKTDVRYLPTQCFQTFAFPYNSHFELNLATIGERYHEERCALMRHLWLGLTDLYNLFHNLELTPTLVAKVSKQPDAIAAAGYQGLLDLRTRHRELDQAVLTAYGWADPSTSSGQAIDLGHDFHAVDTLPEHDRIRYTISPSARKELLRRLLALNHERAAAEAVAEQENGKKGSKRKKQEEAPQLMLIDED